MNYILRRDTNNHEREFSFPNENELFEEWSKGSIVYVVGMIKKTMLKQQVFKIEWVEVKNEAS